MFCWAEEREAPSARAPAMSVLVSTRRMAVRGILFLREWVGNRAGPVRGSDPDLGHSVTAVYHTRGKGGRPETPSGQADRRDLSMPICARRPIAPRTSTP